MKAIEKLKTNVKVKSIQSPLATKDEVKQDQSPPALRPRKRDVKAANKGQ